MNNGPDYLLRMPCFRSDIISQIVTTHNLEQVPFDDYSILRIRIRIYTVCSGYPESPYSIIIYFSLAGFPVSIYILSIQRGLIIGDGDIEIDPHNREAGTWAGTGNG